MLELRILIAIVQNNGRMARGETRTEAHPLYQICELCVNENVLQQNELSLLTGDHATPERTASGPSVS
jgi:hypothetical protein